MSRSDEHLRTALQLGSLAEFWLSSGRPRFFFPGRPGPGVRRRGRGTWGGAGAGFPGLAWLRLPRLRFGVFPWVSVAPMPGVAPSAYPWPNPRAPQARGELGRWSRPFGGVLGEFLFFPWFPWVSVAVSVHGICFRVPWFPWPTEQADAKAQGAQLP